VNAQKQINNTGILYKTKSGYIQQSPLLGMIHTQTTIVNNLLREFGLTPSSRTRVIMAEPKDKPLNPFAALDCGCEIQSTNNDRRLILCSPAIERFPCFGFVGVIGCQLSIAQGPTVSKSSDRRWK